MALNNRSLRTSKLSAAQKQIVNRALTAGGDLDAALDEGQCSFLAATVAVDLGCGERLLGTGINLPAFFETQALDTLRLNGTEFLPLFEGLVGIAPDADTYFACLASLHK